MTSQRTIQHQEADLKCNSLQISSNFQLGARRKELTEEMETIPRLAAQYLETEDLEWINI